MYAVSYDELEDTIDELDEIIDAQDHTILLLRTKISDLLREREEVWDRAYALGKQATQPGGTEARNPFRT